MNQEQFVEGLKVAVAKSEFEALKSILLQPPGRTPSQKSLQLSKWYHGLNEEDKGNLFEVIKETIDGTIFGLLCVLDSVKTIEDSGDKGNFKLYFEKGDSKILLNDINEDFLHDVWQSVKD